MTLRHSTWHYYGSTSLDSKELYDGSTSHYLNVNKSTIALLSISLYITVPRLFFNLLDSTLLNQEPTSLN